LDTIDKLLESVRKGDSVATTIVKAILTQYIAEHPEKTKVWDGMYGSSPPFPEAYG